MYTEIINKYNVPVPRYTSYPPANYFEPFTNARYLEAVQQSNQLQSAHYRFTCISRFVGTYATIADAIRIPWHVPRLLSHM